MLGSDPCDCPVRGRAQVTARRGDGADSAAEDASVCSALSAHDSDDTKAAGRGQGGAGGGEGVRRPAAGGGGGGPRRGADLGRGRARSERSDRRGEARSVMALGGATLPDDVLWRWRRRRQRAAKLEDLRRRDEWRQSPGTASPSGSPGGCSGGRRPHRGGRHAARGARPVVARLAARSRRTGRWSFPTPCSSRPAGRNITPELEAFLGWVCLPWFRTLEKSAGAISDLRSGACLLGMGRREPGGGLSRQPRPVAGAGACGALHLPRAGPGAEARGAVVAMASATPRRTRSWQTARKTRRSTAGLPRRLQRRGDPGGIRGRSRRRGRGSGEKLRLFR